MKLKTIGFYKELKYGYSDAGSIKELPSTTPQEYEEEIIKYLSKGLLFIASTGISKDVLGTGIIGSPDIMTDGEWCWSKDLIYYIKKYHIKLPDEFIKSIKEKKFIFPKNDFIRLNDLEL